MNAGKSTLLLQIAHNYEEQNMKVMLITAGIDDRYGVGKISNRSGLNKEANVFFEYTDFSLLLQGNVNCILIDESQFLTQKQVSDIAKFLDKIESNTFSVMCFGLRTDYNGELFPGSCRLLAIADEIREVRTICKCGMKATMTLRKNQDVQNQILIGGNDIYDSCCRKCWNKIRSQIVTE